METLNPIGNIFYSTAVMVTALIIIVGAFIFHEIKERRTK
jgi:hypothetical protein